MQNLHQRGHPCPMDTFLVSNDSTWHEHLEPVEANQYNEFRLYPTKKKRTTTFFPLISLFDKKMQVAMKYLSLIKSY